MHFYKNTFFLRYKNSHDYMIIYNDTLCVIQIMVLILTLSDTWYWFLGNDSCYIVTDSLVLRVRQLHEPRIRRGFYNPPGNPSWLLVRALLNPCLHLLGSLSASHWLPVRTPLAPCPHLYSHVRISLACCPHPSGSMSAPHWLPVRTPLSLCSGFWIAFLTADRQVYTLHLPFSNLTTSRI